MEAKDIHHASDLQNTQPETSTESTMEAEVEEPTITMYPGAHADSGPTDKTHRKSRGKSTLLET